MSLAEPAQHQALKEKGAFYTPPRMAEFLANWAIRSPSERVLDPSCGDGEFLVQSASRIRQLGQASSHVGGQLFGVDFDRNAIDQAAHRLTSLKVNPAHSLLNADFFECRPNDRPFAGRLDSKLLPRVDVVVGNPPYIRYHGFRGPTRETAAVAVAQSGIRLTDLTSSWAPFIVHASNFLTESGRLAFVLPGELLTVDYAEPVRRFLLSSFASVQVVLFNQRVFPGVLADTLFLLCDKGGQDRGLSLVRAENLDELPAADVMVTMSQERAERRTGGKWSDLVVPPGPRSLYRNVRSSPSVASLGDFFSVDIGIVTGRNSFFMLTAAEVRSLGLNRKVLLPILSGSRQLHGLWVASEEFSHLQREGSKCFLLNLAGAKSLDPATLTYLNSAAGSATRNGYKTSSRRKWYEVPSVYAPDAFMSYFFSDSPRLTENLVGATSTNTVHRLRQSRPNIDFKEELIASCYSTLTRMSSELEGRSYGGGVGKLETKEAERLAVVVPSPSSIRELRSKRLTLHSTLHAGSIDEATEIVDDILLTGQLEMTRSQIGSLKKGLNAIRSRRLSRMRRGSAAKD